MKSEFNNLLAKRRSIYALGDNVKESLENIYTLIKDTVRNSPTAFNSQTVRTVVLFGKASNERSFLKNIGITCYTGSTKYNRGCKFCKRLKMQ